MHTSNCLQMLLKKKSIGQTKRMQKLVSKRKKILLLLINRLTKMLLSGRTLLRRCSIRVGTFALFKNWLMKVLEILAKYWKCLLFQMKNVKK